MGWEVECEMCLGGGAKAVGSAPGLAEPLVPAPPMGLLEMSVKKLSLGWPVEALIIWVPASLRTERVTA